MRAWPDRWNICFGWFPSESLCTALETWLDEHLSNWKAEELHQAIDAHAESARATGQGRGKGPTGPELKTLILGARQACRDAAGDSFALARIKCRAASGGTEWRPRAKLYSRLERETPEERWETICEPMDEKHRDALRDYADRLPGGYRKYVPGHATGPVELSSTLLT